MQFIVDSKFRDVRHALQYADSTAAEIIAEQFKLKYGEDVFPLGYSATEQQLNSVRNLLQKKVSPLLYLLYILSHATSLRAPIFGGVRT